MTLEAVDLKGVVIDRVTLENSTDRADAKLQFSPRLVETKP